MPRSISLVVSLVLFTLTSNAAFLAIDYGSEWTKASLMTPGRKIDILLNTDSKRKVHSTVSWNKEDRLFGSDAFNSAARFPLDTFPYLKTLLGARCPSSQSSYYSQLSRARVVEDAKRGTCSLERADGSVWSAEELIAMEFAYMKGLAEAEAKETVTEAVVTVPPFYTQIERQSVLDALEIAGLRPIALINDGLAVAINYATTRTFMDQEYHIIYDAGASSTTATLVSFSSQSPSTGSKSKSKSSSKDVTTIEVKSFGFDSKAGGVELDRRLRDYLLERIQAKHQLTLADNDRAMARVWKEAQRVKAILSANADSSIRLESISGDIDFKDAISRSTFEDMAKDLIPRFSQPIADALNAANLKMADVKSVILVGGASRTPMVQSAVKALVGDKVALGVNADEAAVLGAAFYGTTTKTTWRTKPMRFVDVNAYDMQLKYLKEGTNKQMTSIVLPSMSKLGRQNFKRLTFPKRTRDFDVELEYKSLPDSQTPKPVVQAKLSGVAAAIANLTSQGVPTPQVRVSFGYSDSGLAVVEDAVAVGELKRVIEPSKSASDDKKATSADSQTSTNEAQQSTKAAEETPKTEIVTVTAPIELQITPLSISPLSAPEKLNSKSRLAEIAAREVAKAQREKAYNLLEGFLYRLRDLLEDDDSSPFKEFAQPDEQARLSDKLATTMAWLHDEGDEAAADVLMTKRAELETMEQPIINRYKEASTGPKALNDLQKAHALARAFLTEAKANQTAAVEAGETPRFTDDDMKSIDTLVTESENWLRERMQQQKKLTKREDPVLKTAEMESRGVAIQKMVQGLQKRKPFRPKTTTSSTKSATATPTPTTDSGESQSTDKENRSREEL